MTFDRKFLFCFLPFDLPKFRSILKTKSVLCFEKKTFLTSTSRPKENVHLIVNLFGTNVHSMQIMGGEKLLCFQYFDAMQPETQRRSTSKKTKE